MPSPFVLVLGLGPEMEAPEAPKAALSRLGARVVTLELWDDPATALEDGAAVRAVVIQSGERTDLAVSALRAVRAVPELERVPALLTLPPRQLTHVEPSSGFDDFLVLPATPAEIYARLRWLEWRTSEFSGDERQKMGRLVVDRAAHEATVDGGTVKLTAKEFALLAFLVEHRGRVFSRDRLLARVWGPRYEGGPRTVDIHVRRLRAKLGDAFPLETLRGAGYKLPAPSDAPSRRAERER